MIDINKTHKNKICRSVLTDAFKRKYFFLLICVGIFSVDLQQNKQTVLIEYQSPFSFCSPSGIPAEFAVLFCLFTFCFEASISSSITLRGRI